MAGLFDDLGGAAVDGYAIEEDHVVLVRRGREERLALTDPTDPVFLRLPRVDLPDGTPLRRAAFDAWAHSLRARVAAGVAYESLYRAPRPFVTGLAMLGAGTVCTLCSALLWTWALRPRAAVTVEPGLAESLGWVVAVGLVVGVVVLAFAAFLRAWLTRRGSYVQVGVNGLRTRHRGTAEPLGAIAAATWHPFVRCTRIEFADGRPVLWVPAESGVLRRLDLLLAALDDRLGSVIR